MKLLKYRDKEIMLPHSQSSVKGRFRLEVLKNGRVTRQLEFDNLITDLGMQRLQAANGPGATLQYCHAGTGTGTPAFSDVALGAFTAASTASGGSWPQNIVTSTPRYGETTITFNFAIGALNGNYTEVGVSSQNTTGGLFSRALILDGGGLPTSLTVLSDEQLRVTYVIRYYLNETDVVDAAVAITGAPDTPYSVTMRRIEANDAGANTAQSNDDGFFLPLSVAYGQQRLYTGSLVAITGTIPSGTNLGAATTVTQGSYTPGVYQRDVVLTWSPATGNGSIKSIKVNYWCAAWQLEFDVAIVKTSLFSFSYTHRVILARL